MNNTLRWILLKQLCEGGSMNINIENEIFDLAKITLVKIEDEATIDERK